MQISHANVCVCAQNPRLIIYLLRSCCANNFIEQLQRRRHTWNMILPRFSAMKDDRELKSQIRVQRNGMARLPLHA